ncbi:MAG: copper amine oxidase N-terminal domain-containing protein, partial [Caldisericia bacterium]|nr:copper amine oxidase N-terminal domain-containing protein [Caldisericia bacterium]
MNKKIILRLVCVVLVLLLSESLLIAYALQIRGLSQTTFIFHIGLQEVQINQERWIMDVAPELKNHRTFIPLRFLVEKMGAEVSWRENPDISGEGVITIQFTHSSGYYKKIILHTNYTAVFIETKQNEQTDPTIQTITLDVAPYIKLPNNRTLVPIRFVSESVGAVVTWEENTQQVMVVWNGFAPPNPELTLQSFSQPLPKMEWSKQMESNAVQRGNCIQSTIDGGYILCGSEDVSDNEMGIYITKLTAEGTPEWEKRLVAENGLSTGVFVNQTADNGYLVIGNYTNPTEEIQSDIILY